MVNEEELLKILAEHGKNFLGSFAPPQPSSAVRKRKIESDDEEEEWHGIQEISSSPSEEGDTETDFEQSEDDFVADNTKVVVFSDPSASSSMKQRDPISKFQRKSFMSSRVSKLTSDSAKIIQTEEHSESEEERSNAQNDALLHRLVHTQLLSGSRNSDLNLTPAQRKRALAGRILELAGTAKLGKGEKVVTEAERRRAGKNVREGLASKQKEKEKQRLEEAKNLGNYHPVIKRVYEASNKSKTSGRRNRGLKMGVGRFEGGVLKLSREDINKVEGTHSRSSTKNKRPVGQRGRAR